MPLNWICEECEAYNPPRWDHCWQCGVERSAVRAGQHIQRKRNRIILIALVSLVAVCVVTCSVFKYGLRRAFADVVQIDSQQGRELAQQITDYDLPVGYQEVGGTAMLGIVTVMFFDEEHVRNAIWLVQTPHDSAPVAEQFLRDGIVYEADNPITWEAEDVESYTIRGKKTAITAYRGVTQDQQRYHAWAGNFEGKGGSALVVIVAPEETWDEDIAKAFINSMR